MLQVLVNNAVCIRSTTSRCLNKLVAAYSLVEHCDILWTLHCDLDLWLIHFGIKLCCEEFHRWQINSVYNESGENLAGHCQNVTSVTECLYQSIKTDLYRKRIRGARWHGSSVGLALCRYWMSVLYWPIVTCVIVSYAQTVVTPNNSCFSYVHNVTSYLYFMWSEWTFFCQMGLASHNYLTFDNIQHLYIKQEMFPTVINLMFALCALFSRLFL